MNKTFKKAIAVILSVLMVVLSVPFTALAAPGDYEPNAKMYFGTFTEASATSFTDYSTCGTAASDFGSYASLYGVPVDYSYKVVDGNKTSGTLSINKDKANTYIDAAGLSYDKLSQDTQLGVGDYFTMTLSLENIKKIKTFMSKIQFSDSIEPAGVYSYKANRKTVYKLGTESERVAANGTWVADKGGTNYLPLYSMCTQGVSKDAFNPELDPNDSKITANEENGKYNIIEYSFACDECDTSAISDPDGYFVDPATGGSGYKFADSAPLTTFVFKIVTDGPIEFNVYNPTDLTSLLYVATTDDGTMLSQCNTYAKNVYNEVTNTNDGATEHPGSRKMTFMGFNEFREAPKPSTHTITFTPYGGEPTTQTVNDGVMPTIPDNTVATKPVASDSTHHSVTSYRWTPEVVAATADAAYTEEAVVTNPECVFVVTDHKDATYKEAGYDVYTCTENCGNTYTNPIDKLPCDHADTKVVNATNPTINNAGYTGDTVCNVCGDTINTGTVIAQLNGEAYRAALKAAKDVDASKYTADSYAKVTEALAAYDEATVGAYTSQEDVNAATAALNAAVDGLVNVYTIKFAKDNGDVVSTQTVTAGEMPKVPTENTASTPVAPLENNQHGHTEYSWPEVSAATKDFTYDEQANVIKENCTDGEVVVTPAELDKAGSKETHCAVCKQVIKTEVIPALQGVNITVAATTLGSTTLNDADATNGLVKRVVLGSDVVLTAKSKNETGEFVGWKVGNKIVSDEATFKTVATADITYEAVFAEKVDTSFTVVFVDPYGNVISTQPVTSGADIKVPTAPTLIGYTFTGWSMTPEAISKLTDGATIYAQYKKDNVAKYTVTAPEGATLTVDGVETASPATVAYDAKVSVHKDGVAAWQVDGVTVAYGDTYTFFCGSDMNLVAVDTAVEKETTVVITGVNEIAGSVQVSFAASRNVAPGETVVKQGFIYGKNLADSELTLENVGNKGADANAGTVKIAYTKNSAADISLRYGLSKRDGKVSAAAFVITKTADGTLNKTISEVKSYTYH